MFSESRVTQMAAYFLMKRGGRMTYIKLLKLLYLAERNAMAKWGESISGDRFVSMPHGPVLSQTYDIIRGHFSQESVWDKWIKDESNYEVSLRRNFEEHELDELSKAEVKILDQVFDEFGHMTRFELVDYTHNHCREWENPNGSSFPIKPENLLRAVGKTEEQVQKLVSKYKEQQALDVVRASLV